MTRDCINKKIFNNIGLIGPTKLIGYEIVFSPYRVAKDIMLTNFILFYILVGIWILKCEWRPMTWFFFFNERKMGRGTINVAILFGHDYNSTLPVRSKALLECRRTTVSHSFPTLQETLVNLELLGEITQVISYLNLNLGPHTQRILCITQEH